MGENSRQRRQFVHPFHPSVRPYAALRFRAYALRMAGGVRRAARRQSSKTRPFSLPFLSLLPLLSRGQQFQNTEKVSTAIRASRSDVEFGCGNLIYCRWRGSLLHQGTQLTEDKRRFAVVVIRHACTRKLHISPIDAQSDTFFFSRGTHRSNATCMAIVRVRLLKSLSIYLLLMQKCRKCLCIQPSNNCTLLALHVALHS